MVVAADWPYWASNFYPESGKPGWRTTEHVYQAMKSLDPIDRRRIREATTPTQAKRLGRVVKIRDDWEKIKEEAMLEAVKLKFAPGSKLAQLLIEHQGPLVEHTTWHDLFWGVCDCATHEGFGQNKLGLILTRVRQELLTMNLSVV